MNIIVTLTGFFMAMADSVPGISGGTIAYIMGVYDNIIESVSNIFSTDKEKRKKALPFLLKLGTGWVIGFVIAILIVSNLVNTHIYQISSMFLGFIFISIYFTFLADKDFLLANKKHAYFIIIGVLGVIIVAYAGSNILDESTNTEFALNFGSILYYFVAGFFAISFMLLPGISGSTVMLIFGIYYDVIAAAKSFITMDFSSLPILISVGLGIVVGGVSAVKILNFLFKRFRAQLLFLIQGLLIGSLYAITVGPTSEFGAPLTLETFNLIWFAVGIVLIILLEKLSVSQKKQ
ncbi:MAG: DUF368 domain-containing protein [Mycoplasmatales bacterium]